MTLELAATDTSRWIDRDIWSDEAVVGGSAPLEIVTDLALDGRESAATELLVGDDLVGSAIPRYTSNGDLKYRQIELAFCGVVGTGGCSFPASLQEISSGEPTDSLMLRDTEASNHGLHLEWGIAEEKVDGWNPLSGDPPPTCIIGGPGGCVEPPPYRQR